MPQMIEDNFANGYDAAARHDRDEFKRLDARIAELEALLQVSRDLNKKYVHALRSVADYRFAVEMTDDDEMAIAAYSGAVNSMRLLARQALPITE